MLRNFRSSILTWYKKDYYSILRIPRSSSIPDIKQAYFSLVKEFHPDINKSPDAKQKFSEISIAYDTLIDPKTRKIYDLTGHSSEEQDQSYYSTHKNPGFSPSETEEDNFEDAFTHFNDFFSSQKIKTNKKGQDLSLSIDISFMESVNGVKKSFSIERKSLCHTCKGSKVNSLGKCSNCAGCGVVWIKKGSIKVQITCSKCKGTGAGVKNDCVPCHGSGFILTESHEIVDIPAGVADGQNLRLSNKGNISEHGGPQGDLLLKVQVLPHPIFKRQGQDILSDIFITVTQAVLGGEILVDTVHGPEKLKIDQGTNSGDLKKVPQQGMKNLPPNSHKKGDHVFTLKIQVPNSLSPKQRKIFEQLTLEDEKNQPILTNLNKFKTFYK